MSLFRSRCMLWLLWLLGGCAAHQNQSPPVISQSMQEQRTAAELLNLGQSAAERGDVVRAEQYLALAIERGANQRQVMPLLLRACLSSSHLRAALNYAEPYLLEHPEDDQLRYLVANVHLGLGQTQEARRELGLLLGRNSANSDAHYLLGIMFSLKDVAQARAHFLKAVEHSRDRAQKVEIGSRMAELALRDREQEFAPVLVNVAEGGRP